MGDAPRQIPAHHVQPHVMAVGKLDLYPHALRVRDLALPRKRHARLRTVGQTPLQHNIHTVVCTKDWGTLRSGADLRVLAVKTISTA